MNETIQNLAIKSGMLNYVDNETPRYYFIDGHATEEELQKFAELIIDQCIEIIYNVEKTPPGYIQPKNASIYEHALREQFGVKRK